MPWIEVSANIPLLEPELFDGRRGLQGATQAVAVEALNGFLPFSQEQSFLSNAPALLQ